MAIPLSSIQRDNAPKPSRLLVYGVHGVGKTTFGACAPAPIVIRTEDGLGVLDVAAFPLAESFSDVIGALEGLASEDHEFKTLVVDSLDWLEPMIWAEVCADNKVRSIEDIPYGKGYVAALDFWRQYIAVINYLRNVKGMTIIQIAHCEIKRFDDPSSDGYDRYNIKLHKAASALVQEHVDCVLFANYKVGVTTEDKGFKNKRKRAIGSGERVLYTQERPSFIAKNRYALPEMIPMDWVELAAMIPYYNGK